MNTESIMKLACDLVGYTSIPEDSKIYVHGDSIKKVLFGVDITSAELKIAKDLGYDLVIAHHPINVPNKHNVYLGHQDLMINAGVPKQIAKDAVMSRMESFDISSQVMNHDHTSSVAELLEIPFMNIHQPCDEIGRRVIQNKIDDLLLSKPTASLEELINAISEIPEFETALSEIKLLMGDKNNKAGKVVFAHGAYTNGGYEVANAYYEHGVDTVIYIHILYNDLLKLRKEFKGNLITTGHIVSDEIGINPLIEALEAKGLQVDIISGLRYKRRS